MGQSWTNRVHRVMLLCAVHLSLYVNCYADQGGKKVTLNVVNESCVRVFKQIEKQTKMSFFYSTSDISLPAKVTVKAVEKPLDEVMELILDGTGLEWVYTDNVITVRKKKEQGRLVESDGDSSITMLAVTGKVTDANGEAIPGATVLVKRTRDGVTTDADGKFALPKIRKNDVLTISSIGYETRDLAVRGNTILAQLNLFVSKLDETVVIAYGTTTKRYNTGSVSTVKAEEIAKQPVSNPLQALQGRVPGMTITQTTGLPGGAFKVLIRGQNSISSGNEPLYVIDGVPYSLPSLVLNYGPTNNGNALNYIDPSSIERIDILKDADATAIYGSRGANGVVLITTKKGQSGTMKGTINVYSGLGQVTRKLKLLNTPEYLHMRREAFMNDNEQPNEANAPDLLSWDTTRYTDWQKELIGGTAHFTNLQGSLSGGSSNVQYILGGGYQRESTVFPGSLSDQKISAHVNLNATSPNQKFHASITSNYTVDINRLIGKDLTDVTMLPPNAPPLYDSTGKLNWANSSWANPFANLELRYKAITNNLVSNFTFDYTILKGLIFKTSIGYTNTKIRETSAIPSTFWNPSYGITTGSASFNNKNIESWIIEPQLTYIFGLWKGNINLLLGSTLQKNSAITDNINATGYTNDAFLDNITGAAQIQGASSGNIIYKYNAGFFRLNYNILDKYILNFTGRRDGSSRFGPGKQFANFGALGAAWIFSSEDFVKKALPFLSFGKLRASYGTTGNDQINDYRYLELYYSSNYPYQNTRGLYPANLFNPDYAWEVNKKLEFGLETGTLNDRLQIGISYFRNRSSNQLVGYSLPTMTGFPTIVGNLPAIVQNKGAEFSVTSTNLKRNGFEWSTSANLTISRNKLISFPNLETSSYAYSYIIGKPLNIQMVYKSAGTDPETGLYQFTDFKGNLTKQPSFETDRTSLIDINPQYYGGLQNSISFKNLTLDFLVQFVKQTGSNTLFENIPPGSNYTPYGLPMANQTNLVLNRWQKAGDKGEFQKFTQGFGDAYSSYTFIQNSDVAFSDASFIRLKNISLSYNLPESWIRKMRIESFRLYIQAQNLFTITKYKGRDPENQSSISLPPLRVITFGAQLTL